MLGVSSLLAVKLQPRTTVEASQVDILAVPVLLNLRSSLTLPLAPLFEDGPAAWITCGANVTALHPLLPLPTGKVVCVIELYEQDAVQKSGGGIEEGVPLTPAWLPYVLRRSEWDDAIAVGPVLSVSAAQSSGLYMHAVAVGNDDDARTLAGNLLPAAPDAAERAARRFRAEVQVSLLG